MRFSTPLILFATIASGAFHCVAVSATSYGNYNPAPQKSRYPTRVHKRSGFPHAPGPEVLPGSEGPDFPHAPGPIVPPGLGGPDSPYTRAIVQRDSGGEPVVFIPTILRKDDLTGCEQNPHLCDQLVQQNNQFHAQRVQHQARGGVPANVANHLNLATTTKFWRGLKKRARRPGLRGRAAAREDVVKHFARDLLDALLAREEFDSLPSRRELYD
ncbi:hypothetical protein BC835DRAFT_1309194 [Cytidiella melzeri]|nr:hypothetical protein BC835DRAFT_1309194 [Cytidiella melzeri]